MFPVLSIKYIKIPIKMQRLSIQGLSCWAKKYFSIGKNFLLSFACRQMLFCDTKKIFMFTQYFCKKVFSYRQS